MKVIIAGSRSITDMSHVLKAIELSKFDITEVVCGEAKGVDTLGRQWAEANNILVASFPANWRPNGNYNRNAGYERNEEMGLYSQASVVIWDGESIHMHKYMKSLGKPSYLHNINNTDLFDL